MFGICWVDLEESDCRSCLLRFVLVVCKWDEWLVVDQMCCLKFCG